MMAEKLNQRYSTVAERAITPKIDLCYIINSLTHKSEVLLS
jgi:hypothetical protein